MTSVFAVAYSLVPASPDYSWWKVQVKSESEDDERLSGLIPAAYVELVSPGYTVPTAFSNSIPKADHVSLVKVLYDYEASAPGELTVNEGEVLLVYETDQDWLLVQSQKEDGRAGYVPGNYVEATSDAESTTAPTANVPSVRYCALALMPRQAHILFRPGLSVLMLILLTEWPLPRHHSLMLILSRPGQSQILTKKGRRRKERWVLGMVLYSLLVNPIR